MSYLRDFLDKAEYKAVAEIGYSDLERLMNNFFQAEIDPTIPYYEMVPSEEWSNYSKHSFILCKKQKHDWQQEEIDQHIETMRLTKMWPECATDDLLQYMCQKGALPECELIVSVFW